MNLFGKPKNFLNSGWHAWTYALLKTVLEAASSSRLGVWISGELFNKECNNAYFSFTQRMPQYYLSFRVLSQPEWGSWKVGVQVWAQVVRDDHQHIFSFQWKSASSYLLMNFFSIFLFINDYQHVLAFQQSSAHSCLSMKISKCLPINKQIQQEFLGFAGCQESSRCSNLCP